MVTGATERGDLAAQRNERILGFDVARAVAILGMFVVHFSMVAAADPDQPAWMARLLGFLDGRSAATFMILGGIGLTHFPQRSVAAPPKEFPSWKSILFRRGLILVVAGFINLTIWQGDILRVYGVSL